MAERQYLDLSDDTRALVDDNPTLLESNPASLPDAIYDSASDRWSTPIGEQGLMLSAVLRKPATVIVLRLIAFLPQQADEVVSLKVVRARDLPNHAEVEQLGLEGRVVRASAGHDPIVTPAQVGTAERDLESAS